MRRAFCVSVAAMVAMYAVKAHGQDINGRPVRLRVDDFGLASIPTIARKDLNVQRDSSREAEVLGMSAPPQRGLPIFFIVVGLIGISVRYQSILEMIRQTYYGGIHIDTRARERQSLPPVVIFLQTWCSLRISLGHASIAAKNSVSAYCRDCLEGFANEVACGFDIANCESGYLQCGLEYTTRP